MSGDSTVQAEQGSFNKSDNSDIAMIKKLSLMEEKLPGMIPKPPTGLNISPGFE